MRKVEIGLEEGNNIQIIDGVVVGEMVVTVGNFNLKNGASVKIVKAVAEKIEGEKK